MPSDNKPSVKIRMYRQGLGDCFLLTFKQEGSELVNMLIDCGLLQGTPEGSKIMKQVVGNIRDSITKTTGNGIAPKKLLDFVLLTHEHADHTSGFKSAKVEFQDIEFGQVWTSWLDDKSHPDYMEVRKQFSKQILGLTAATAKMTSDASLDLKAQINAILDEFFDEELLSAGEDLEKRSDAWAFVLDRSVTKPEYFVPGKTFTIPGLEAFRFYILGPPLNYTTFSRVDPPDDESYRPENSKLAIAESFFASVVGASDLFDAESCQPFEPHVRISQADAEDNSIDPFFVDRYGFGTALNDWRRIGDDWLMTAGSLALNLDNYTNNTCLAIAIEMVDSGKVLLFPGDAQFANWNSWKSLSFDVPDANGVTKKITVKDLLNRTVFYKVGHHGSHNATLKTHGLELMNDPDLVAMIPVDREMAKSKTSRTNPNGWEMPEANLFDTLKRHTRGRIVIADEVDKTHLSGRCTDSDFISRVNFDKLLFSEPIVGKKGEPMYVELTIDG